MVLLKNANGTLPLNPAIKHIAVIGPTAELVQSLQGNYNGPPPSPVSPLAGVEKRFATAKVAYAQGSTLVDGFAMPVAHTALQATTGTAEGLTAEYFPSPDFTGPPALTRTDRTVNFNWDKVVPVPGLQRNNYSVRWSGNFVPPAPGDYKLGVRVNPCYACKNAEGFRLYVDGKLMVASDRPQGDRADLSEASLHFSDTQPHPIRLEYRHGTGSAGIDLTWQAPAAALRTQAVAAAKNADVILAFVGLSPSLEGEEMPVKLEGFTGGDRTSIDLPRTQNDLLTALAATGKPLVVILQNGSALAVNWAQAHAAALLEAWYPGEEGGTAIAETLAGDNDPAGRLPLTFYASLDQLPAFEDYAMKSRTYRYFTGTPLFRFGYGLSYTSFAYSPLIVPAQTVKAGDPVVVETKVQNIGPRAGDEVVELYLSQPKTAETPRRVLAGFTRIHLGPGESTHVALTVDPRSLGQVDSQGHRVILPGSYTVSVGGAQPGVAVATQTGSFTVTGTMPLPQ